MTAVAQIADDVNQIGEELKRLGTSRREKRFTGAHENFCWLSEKASREAAVDEQKRYMLGVVSDERPWDYIEAVYLTCTIEDIQRRIQQRIASGVEAVFLHTMTATPHQRHLMAKHILEPS